MFPRNGGESGVYMVTHKCYHVLFTGDTDVVFVMLQAVKRPLVYMGVWRFAG